MKEQRLQLKIDGVTLDTRIVRKRVRHVNARLVGEELRVSAPPGVSSAELEEIVERLAGRLVRRARAEALNSGDEARTLALKIARRFPEPPEIGDVRFTTGQWARWGSYSRRTATVRLNAGLRQLPPWVLEAVVAHELAHAFHPDHSRAFWELLRRVCPETDRAQAFLEGVHWIATRWDSLPPVERSLLARSG
jgi:predicted metal-dependent hydrolase